MDTTDRLLYRPGEFAEAIGVSRSKAYQMIASGEVPSVTIAGLTRVPVAAAKELIDRLTKARDGGGRVD